MTRLRIGLAFLLVACLTGAHAHAGDKEEAEKHFRAGVSLQKLEDFDAAIAAFETSLRLYPTQSALFNLANCLRATHRYDEALKTLEQLDRDHGDQLDAAMRSAVDRQLEELRNLSAGLVVQVEQSGAEVWIDGALVGRSPLPDVLHLSPGGHDIEVRLEGFEPARVHVELVSREKATEQITLKVFTPPPAPPQVEPPEVEPPPRVEPPPQPAPKEETSSLTTAGWITAGTGTVLLAGGAVTGVWALSLDSKLKDDCVDGHCPPDRSSDIDRLGTLTTTTNILMGVGLTVTAAGVVMLLADQPHGQEAPVPMAVGLSVGPQLVGATVRQRF